MLARLLFIVALLLAAVTTDAHALCRDDLKELRPRIDHMKQANPQRYYLALLWWGDAMEAEAGSESECLHFLAKARKAMYGPIPEIAACDALNMYLPQCQNGGAQNGVALGPVQAIGPVGGPNNGGGGGVQFNPPGSITGPTTTVEATGTER